MRAEDFTAVKIRRRGNEIIHGCYARLGEILFICIRTVRDDHLSLGDVSFDKARDTDGTNAKHLW